MDAISLRLKIEDLNADYARAIDDDRLEDWPDFFLEECLYQITTADNYAKGLELGLVYADSKGMIKDRVASLRQANIYERQRYRHVLGVPAIRRQADGEIQVESTFLVTRIMRDGKMDLFASGRYRDRVCSEGNGLRFRERIVVCDNSRFDTLLALPL